MAGQWEGQYRYQNGITGTFSADLVFTQSAPAVWSISAGSGQLTFSGGTGTLTGGNSDQVSCDSFTLGISLYGGRDQGELNGTLSANGSDAALWSGQPNEVDGQFFSSWSGLVQPVVDGLSLHSGPTTGNTLLWVNGSALSDVTSVTFAPGTPQAATVDPVAGTVGPTSLEVSSPPGSGTADVVVTSQDAQGDTATSDTSVNDQFTWTTPTGPPPGTVGTTVGGGGSGPAENTSMEPGALAEGPQGIFASDNYLNDVDLVANNQVVVAAGSGNAGYWGDGGPAAAAGLDTPLGIAVDKATGNLYIADANNSRIRVVAYGAAPGFPAYGCGGAGADTCASWTVGDIYTVGGGGPDGPADGVPASTVSLSPGGVAVDGQGNLVFTDGNHVWVLAGSATDPGYALSNDCGAHHTTSCRTAWTPGDLYALAGNGTLTGDASAPKALVSGSYGVAVDTDGNVVYDEAGGRVRVIAVGSSPGYPLDCGTSCWADGKVFTVYGNGTSPGTPGLGGPAPAAYPYGDPYQLTLDSENNILVADGGVVVLVAVSPTNPSPGYVLAGDLCTYGSCSSWTQGDAYLVAGDNGLFTSAGGGDGVPALLAEFGVEGVAVDAAGNILLGDPDHYSIRVVADSPTNPGYTLSDACGLNPDPLGAPCAWGVPEASESGDPFSPGLIFTIAGARTLTQSGDGQPAGAAELGGPTDVAYDPEGNLLIADGSDWRVRVEAVSATNPGYPLLDDCGPTADGPCTWTPGDLFTVVGGAVSPNIQDDDFPAPGQILPPTAITVDHDGNVVITSENAVQVLVMGADPGYVLDDNCTDSTCPWTPGDVITVAGCNQGPTCGPQPALTGDLSPLWTAVDSRGDLLISTRGDQVDVVPVFPAGTSPPPTSPYVLAGCDRCAWDRGGLYPLLGTGTRDDTGDGGPAYQADADQPDGLALDAQGNVLVAEVDRIRVVAVGADPGYCAVAGCTWTDGDAYTLTGGGDTDGDGTAAAQAALQPTDVALDSQGNVLVSQSASNTVSVLALHDSHPGYVLGQDCAGAACQWQTGLIFTLAGGGAGQYSPDGSTGTDLTLQEPDGLVVEPGAADLVLAETASHIVRLIGVDPTVSTG